MFKTTVSALAGLAMIVTTGAIVAPEATANVLNQFPQNLAKLTQPDCDKHPRACLTRKQQRLETLSRNLDMSRTRLEAEFGRASEVLGHNKALLGQNQLFLEQGRRMLRESSETGPITFAGENYPTKAQFRDQLELLFLEGARLEVVVADAQSLFDALSAARRNLIARRSEIQATLSILPSKLALLDAQQSYAALTTDLNAIDDVLRAGEIGTQSIDRLLRNTQELAEDEDRRPSGNADFDAWLLQGSSVNGG